MTPLQPSSLPFFLFVGTHLCLDYRSVTIVYSRELIYSFSIAVVLSKFLGKIDSVFRFYITVAVTIVSLSPATLNMHYCCPQL